jgi:hypothetical protein
MTQLPPLEIVSDRQLLAALERRSFSEQLTAIERGEYTLARWRTVRTPEQRLDLLCGLSEDEQLDALRAQCFTLDEWCAFARRAPERVFMLGGEFAFIAITTPEWCER